MARIAITGGAGFIGSNLIKQVDRTKYSVHIMEPEFANVSRLDGQDVVVHRSALSDIENLTNIIKVNNIKIVVHLVSTLIPGSSYEDYKKEFKNVIFPSIELMEICANLLMQEFLQEMSRILMSKRRKKNHQKIEREVSDET